jgi:NAD(P)-dependent dehydrogenase (short-subunit alcohol dehydrogenase family)
MTNRRRRQFLRGVAMTVASGQLGIAAIAHARFETRNPEMILKNKTAVIYGAGGDVGGAVARAFAREGAKLFLSGRTLSKVEAVAADIVSRGGIAEAAQVDALDEQAVEKYVGAVAEKAGAIDVSFCAISIAKALTNKAPLVNLSADQFALPITTYTQANFLTARSAARRMLVRRSGVILTITASLSRIAIPNVGGAAPAHAGVVALSRTLSAELAPQGVRVVCVMPNAMPETATIRENFGNYAKAAGVTYGEYLARIESMTHLRRLTTLAQLANTAVFLVSDQASAMTGTVVNLSGGAVVE